MAVKLAITNNKGGVGKTSVTYTIASVMSHLQKRDPDHLPASFQKKPILIVDIDPQANITEIIGLDPVEVKTTIRELLKEAAEDVSNIKKSTFVKYVYKAKKIKNVEVIPSSIILEGLSSDLTFEMEGRQLLKKALSIIEDNYSMIIIDTPPSLGVFTQNAILAADYTLVPISLSKHALVGLSNMYDFLKKAMRFKDDLNERFFLGILVYAFDKRYSLQKSLKTVAEEDYTSNVFDSFIPTSSRMMENMANNRNVLYNNSNDLKANLIAFVDEIFERGQIR